MIAYEKNTGLCSTSDPRRLNSPKKKKKEKSCHLTGSRVKFQGVILGEGTASLRNPATIKGFPGTSQISKEPYRPFTSELQLLVSATWWHQNCFLHRHITVPQGNGILRNMRNAPTPNEDSRTRNDLPSKDPPGLALLTHTSNTPTQRRDTHSLLSFLRGPSLGQKNRLTH